jgi:hypothetical protein
VDRKKTHIEILKTRHEACMAVAIFLLLLSRLVYPLREAYILIAVWCLGAIIILLFLNRLKAQTAPAEMRLRAKTIGIGLIIFGVGCGVISYQILSGVYSVLPHLRGSTFIIGAFGAMSVMKGIEMLVGKFSNYPTPDL